MRERRVDQALQGLSRNEPPDRRARADAHQSSGARCRLRLLRPDLDREVCDPLALLVLLTGISRILVMEESVGVTAGYAEARALIKWLLGRVVRPAATAGEAPEAEP